MPPAMECPRCGRCPGPSTRRARRPRAAQQQPSTVPAATCCDHREKSPALRRGSLAENEQHHRAAEAEAMSNSGAVTLGDIADKGEILEIECLDCERFGRYRI